VVLEEASGARRAASSAAKQAKATGPWGVGEGDDRGGLAAGWKEGATAAAAGTAADGAGAAKIDVDSASSVFASACAVKRKQRRGSGAAAEEAGPGEGEEEAVRGCSGCAAWSACSMMRVVWKGGEDGRGK